MRQLFDTHFTFSPLNMCHVIHCDSARAHLHVQRMLAGLLVSRTSAAFGNPIYTAITVGKLRLHIDI